MQPEVQRGARVPPRTFRSGYWLRRAGARRTRLLPAVGARRAGSADPSEAQALVARGRRRGRRGGASVGGGHRCPRRAGDGSAVCAACAGNRGGACVRAGMDSGSRRGAGVHSWRSCRAAACRMAAGQGCNAARDHAPAQDGGGHGRRPPAVRCAPRGRPPAIYRHRLQDLFQYSCSRSRRILHDQPVRHRRHKDLLDQVDRHPVIAPHQRQRARQTRHLDSRARAGAGLDGRVAARLANQRHQVGHHLVVDGDRVHHVLPPVEPVLRDHRGETAPGIVAPVLVDDALLVVIAGVPQGELHHEAVELRHRQREQVRAPEVHGGDDEERVGQVIGIALDRDSLLLHRLEEAALGLGREQVDFVAQHEVGEDRAAVEDQGTGAEFVAGEAEDVLRQQVDRALDAAEAPDRHVFGRYVGYRPVGARKLPVVAGVAVAARPDPVDRLRECSGERGLADAVGVREDHVAAGDLGGDQVLQRARVDVDQRADVVDQALDLGTDRLRLGSTEDTVVGARRRGIHEASHNGSIIPYPQAWGKAPAERSRAFTGRSWRSPSPSATSAGDHTADGVERGVPVGTGGHRVDRPTAPDNAVLTCRSSVPHGRL